MNRNTRSAACTVIMFLLVPICGVHACFAQDYAVDWWTVDGGGEMWTSGGDFELSGTIGQADTGDAMTGGDFELIGGFWYAIPEFVLGDTNCDGAVNGFDIDPFVLLMLEPYPHNLYYAAHPDCNYLAGDLNCDGIVDGFDIDYFVACLMTGGDCECP